MGDNCLCPFPLRMLRTGIAGGTTGLGPWYCIGGGRLINLGGGGGGGGGGGHLVIGQIYGE